MKRPNPAAKRLANVRALTWSALALTLAAIARATTPDTP